MYFLNKNNYETSLDRNTIYPESGKITKSLGLLYEAYLPQATIGGVCEVRAMNHGVITQIDAEVIGFRDKKALLMPYDEIKGINNESLVKMKSSASSIWVGYELLGRVIDAQGNPIDGKGPLLRTDESIFKSLYASPSDAMSREVIREPLDLGVKAINSMLTCGKGQRVGIMAGSGVGKSVLLGMMAKNTDADVNVVALIGERGREVREFIERDLGEEGLKRSVVIVATSDKSPLLRMRGAYVATTIAEYFRDRGKDVLLMMDSVTRFCMAQREIGLSMGEPPASKGYTPSVFAQLPKLLERAGTHKGRGSITGLYTVLVEGDDLDDPVADSARAILDGHIVLSRKLAQKNHFPAIDVLMSASRVMRSVISKDHDNMSAKIREWMATYEQAEDLISIGAYAKGSNAKIDQSIAVRDRIHSLLTQSIEEKVNFADAVALLHGICRVGETAVLTAK